MEEYFLNLHKDMPRQGPGNNQITQIALSMINLSSNLKILDIGCGPGMQSLYMAKTLKNCNIIALDYYQQYLDELQNKIDIKTLKSNLELKTGSMFELTFEEESFDLIWSEGAIYIMGFERGLGEWSHFLKPNGYLAVSEITWLSDDRPEEITNYWLEQYPQMNTISENLKIIESQSYQIIGTYTFPESAWFSHYYNPLKERFTIIREKYSNEKIYDDIIREEKKEIEMLEKYSQYYSYVFYVMRKL